MRWKQGLFQIMTFACLVTIFLLTFYFDHQQSRKAERVLPDVNQSTSDDARLKSPFGNSENTKGNEERKIFANLQDIQKASTTLFPVQHILRDGREWITSELEEYLVLYYTDPLLKDFDVQGVQRILQDLGFYNGAIDGVYGQFTLQAVKHFQQYYGLETTGIMDLDDYNLLSDVYEATIPAVQKAKPTGTVSLLAILDERTLYVLVDGEVYHQFPVAIGTPDTPTPIGNWKIISKGNWGGGFGARWLGINVPYGKYGIHGTDKPWSVGAAESHGCLRMFNRDVELLSSWATWGTKVYIVGGNFPYNLPWRIMDDGDRGSDIWILQNRLKELGYYKGNPDGIFGWGTGSVVRKFQQDHKLPVTGKVDWSTREKLELIYFQ